MASDFSIWCFELSGHVMLRYMFCFLVINNNNISAMVTRYKRFICCVRLLRFPSSLRYQTLFPTYSTRTKSEKWEENFTVLLLMLALNINYLYIDVLLFYFYERLNIRPLKLIHLATLSQPALP